MVWENSMISMKITAELNCKEVCNWVRGSSCVDRYRHVYTFLHAMRIYGIHFKGKLYRVGSWKHIILASKIT